MLNLTDFGIYPNTGQDVTAGIANAVAVARTDMHGGNLYIPEGQYITSGPVGIDLRGVGQIRLYGDGPARTLITYMGTGIGIALGGNGTGICRKQGIEGIFVRQGVEGLWHPNQVSGNWGIATTHDAGSGVFIKDCAVVGFGHHGIVIGGPTGPTLVEDVEIYRCCGYGIVAANFGEAPQDLTINGGSIQDNWGGIALTEGCTSTGVYDTDIELGPEGRYPAIRIAVGGGHSFHNVTASAHSSLSEAALVYCEGFGNTFTGGLYLAPPGCDNFWFMGSNANSNVVMGGHHGGSTGYFARVWGGVDNSFISPNLKPGYHAGRAGVHSVSGADNRTFTIGIPAVPAI